MADHQHGEMDITTQEIAFAGFIKWSKNVAIVSIGILIPGGAVAAPSNNWGAVAPPTAAAPMPSWGGSPGYPPPYGGGGAAPPPPASNLPYPIHPPGMPSGPGY